MKRLILYIMGTVFAISIYAQSTLKDFVGLPIDSLGPKELVLDSTVVERSASAEARTPRVFGGELHPQIPTSFAIDRTKDVGEITCNTAVTPSGAMTMSVPIEACPDPRGFTPQISLSYNSLGSNGALGNGWSLSGASVITGANKSIYYDGQTVGVSVGSFFSSFVLDGQRLIQVEVASAAVNYETEQGNIKVVGYHTLLMKSFKAYFPDGRCAWYDTNDGVTFYVTKMVDKAGNEINYTYTLIGEHYRLSKITYGSTKQAYIQFNYTTTRPDVQETFSAGKKFTYDYLLSSITTSLYGSAKRTYLLTYTTVGGVSTISKIDCTALGCSLNPLILYYGDNQQSQSYQKDDTQLMHWYNFDAAWKVRTVKGKFDYGTDNDGIIMLPNKIHYKEYWRKPGTWNHSRSFFENEYTGDETIIVATGLSGSYAMFNPELKAEYGFIDIFCMDVDEVKGEEIVKVNNYVSGDLDKVDFHVYTSNLYYGIVKKYTRSFSFNTLLQHRDAKSINPKFYYTGDFNGDGKMELLVVTANNALGKNAPTMCYLIDLEGNKILYEGSPFVFWQQFPKYGDDTIMGDVAANNSNKLYVLDYNGDGKSEVCLIYDSETMIYSFSSGAAKMSCSKITSDTQLNNTMLRDRDFLPGEFNGDGKTDLLLSPTKNGGSTWSIFSSKGNGSFDKKDITITTKIESSRFMLQDMNSDGQTDLVETYGTSANVNLVTYFISNRTHKGSSSTTVPKETVLIPTNIQSRNYYSKLISLRTGGIASRIGYQNDDSKNRLLTGIVNSYGTITKVGYQDLNDENSRVYTPGYGAQFPYQNYEGGLTVVSNLAAYNNATLLNDSYYQYSNAIIHKQGLGFKGFEKITVNDNVTGRFGSQIFDPFRFSIPVEDDSREQLNTNTYTVTVASNKIAKVRLSSKVSKDKLKNVSVTSSYTYDYYNNILKETVNYGGGIETVKSCTYRNIDKDSTYIIGLPVAQDLTNKRNGTSSLVSMTKLNYNAKYLPILKEQFITASEKVKEEVFEYNSSLNFQLTFMRQ